MTSFPVCNVSELEFYQKTLVDSVEEFAEIEDALTKVLGFLRKNDQNQKADNWYQEFYGLFFEKNEKDIEELDRVNSKLDVLYKKEKEQLKTDFERLV